MNEKITPEIEEEIRKQVHKRQLLRFAQKRMNHNQQKTWPLYYPQKFPAQVEVLPRDKTRIPIFTYTNKGDIGNCEHKRFDYEINIMKAELAYWIEEAKLENKLDKIRVVYDDKYSAYYLEIQENNEGTEDNES